MFTSAQIQVVPCPERGAVPEFLNIEKSNQIIYRLQFLPYKL